MNNIHVLEKYDTGKCIQLSSQPNVWASGTWAMKPDKAKSLIGNLICIHKSQKEPYVFGGRILAVNHVDGGRDDRHCIQFEVSESVKGRLHEDWRSGSARASEPVDDVIQTN